MYICIFTYSLNKFMSLSSFVKVLMWVSPKDSQYVSLDVSATEGLTLRVFRCGCHGRTDTASLSMWMSRKDSQYASLDVGATEGVTLHLSRCGCQESTYTACLLM